MRAPSFNPRFILPLAIIAAFVVYGSLYPFNFQADTGSEALATLLATWRFRAEHFGNLIGNIFFYMPLGLFGMLCLGNRANALLRVMALITIGAVLSCSMEFVQLYLPSRVSTLADVYPNTLGTGLGALAGSMVGSQLRGLPTQMLRAQPLPALLLGAFLAYRLFPYVPSLDLHQYWQSLKPILLHPHFAPFPMLRYAVFWLVLAALGQALVGPARMRWLLVPTMLCLLAAQVVITQNQITAPEIAAGVLVVPVWLLFSRLKPRSQALILGAILATFVVASRLQPFHCGATLQTFGWVPFQSFMTGSMAINTQSFLEKFFLYGSLLWLLTRGGANLGVAAVMVALGLFATSLAQICLSGRSAEITDAAMVLAIAGLFALIDRATRQRAAGNAGPTLSERSP